MYAQRKMSFLGRERETGDVGMEESVRLEEKMKWVHEPYGHTKETSFQL
jgi:hypothetical protein